MIMMMAVMPRTSIGCELFVCVYLFFKLYIFFSCCAVALLLLLLLRRACVRGIKKRSPDCHVSPSLISLMVSVDVKHHVYLLPCKKKIRSEQLLTFLPFHSFRCPFTTAVCLLPARRNLCRGKCGYYFVLSYKGKKR